MSKPVIFALLAVVFYAVASVALEQKFSKYNNLSLLVVYAFIVMTLALSARSYLKTADPVWDFPTGQALLLMGTVGVVFFLADYFYLGAYTNKGDVITITTIVTLTPVVASVVKYLWVGGVPNSWQFAAYASAAVTVMLAAKGASQATPG